MSNAFERQREEAALWNAADKRINQLKRDYKQVCYALERCQQNNVELLKIIADAPHDHRCNVRWVCKQCVNEYGWHIRSGRHAFDPADCDCWKSKVDDDV